VKRALLWFDVVATLVLVALAFRYAPRTGYFYAGLGLTAAAMPFWILARLQLGRSFSVTAQARQLVTHGLYSSSAIPSTSLAASRTSARSSRSRSGRSSWPGWP
jgi:protein-S-isoprenylcysteine O-methyltransferase Ste14